MRVETYNLKYLSIMPGQSYIAMNVYKDTNVLVFDLNQESNNKTELFIGNRKTDRFEILKRLAEQAGFEAKIEVHINDQKYGHVEKVRFLTLGE